VSTRPAAISRKINFITLDDGYQPPRPSKSSASLSSREGPAAVQRWAPTNTAIHRTSIRRKIPHLYVSTGASKWRPQGLPWTMGFRPDYHTEA
jgi:hypothetical protein